MIGPWRWLLPWAALVMGVLALGWGGYRWAYARGVAAEAPRAEKRGALAQDKVWMQGLALARARAEAEARRVAREQVDLATRVEAKHASDVAGLRDGYRAVRERVRASRAGAGGAGGADLPAGAGAAAGVDGAGGADDDAVAAARGALTDALIAASEEGDRYRAQVMGWQDWARGLQAIPPPE